MENILWGRTNFLVSTTLLHTYVILLIDLKICLGTHTFFVRTYYVQLEFAANSYMSTVECIQMLVACPCHFEQ